MCHFRVGKTYYMRSICDHNCIWNCTVFKRTKCFVSLKIKGYVDPVKVKIHTEEGFSECCYPLGTFSMCPLLNSEREVV